MKKNRYFLVFLLVFAVYWRFLWPGIKVAGDFTLLSSDVLNSRFAIPFIWQERGAEGLGEYALAVLWTWPNDLIFGLGSRIGLGFSIIEKIFGGILVFVLGFWGIKRILKEERLFDWAIVVGILVFLVNSYLILLIDGGQLSIALAYAFIPISYFAIVKSISSGLRSRLLAGMVVSIQGFIDIRFLYVLLLLLFIKFIFDLFANKKNIRRYLGSWFVCGAVVILVFIGLHFYWLLPAFLARVPSLPATYARETQIFTLSFANLDHAMGILSPHWYKNVFGDVSLFRPEFILIPVLAFLAPVLKRKNKTVAFWLVVSLVSIFLVKGANNPLGSVNTWMFGNIPGFDLFRDPSKFFVLIALSYSVLIAFSIDGIIRKVKKMPIGINKYFATIPLMVIVYLILTVYPSYTGKMTGMLSNPAFLEEYEFINDYLTKDKKFSRVLWLPSIPPMGIITEKHPALEGTRIFSRRAFSSGVVGTYEVLNFVRETPYMGELFDVSGVGYVSYPYPDERRVNLKPDNIDYYFAFWNQISSLTWVDKVISEPPVALLKTKGSQDRFFVTENTWYVVGSDRVYLDLLQKTNLKLSNNAFIFAEEKVNLGKLLEGNPDIKILIFDKSEIDLAATMIDKKDLIFPSEGLDFDPSENSESLGWWKRETEDFVWWRDFLQQKYEIDNQDFDLQGGWAVAEGSKELNIKDERLTENKTFLTRVMSSSRGGKIEFWQGKDKIGEIYTKINNPKPVAIKLSGYMNEEEKSFSYDKAVFNWYEVGRINNTETLTIKTEGEINVVNSIALITPEQWGHIYKSTEGLSVYRLDELNEYEINNLFSTGNEKNIIVSYEKINPTHYRVKVDGLSQPVTLAFSQSYDYLWELNGNSSYPLYALINGFRVEKDGEYDVYYSAQKYVSHGLLVSAFSVAALLFVLMVLRKKGPKPV